MDGIQVQQQFINNLTMRYNSLRSQLNWHSRQQTHIFKKISKNTIDREQLIQQENKVDQDHHLKGHELIWLEKMMKELHHYKEEASDKEANNRKGKEEGMNAILKEKCGNINKQSKIIVEKDKKAAVNLDQNGKSAKKIKFQIVINQDKCQSIKKVCVSQQKPKNKSSKKIPSKTVPKKMITQKASSANKPNSSKELIKQVNNSCPSNTKVIEIQEIKTDPYSFKQADIQILEQLWKKQSEQVNEPQPKLSSKKSIGKIIKNSEKLNKTCIQMNKQAKQTNESNPHGISCNTANGISHQNSSYKQYKQTKHKQSTSIHSFQSKELSPLQVKQAVSNQFKTHPSVEKSKDIKIIQKHQEIKIPQHKLKYQKIYIKLQTQKLSQYLSEKSQVKIHQEPNEKIIQTNQYQKYCVTKRAQKPPLQVEEKNLTSQKKLNQYSNEGKNKQQNAPRTKSQQRKLNRLAQNIRPTKLFDFQSNIKQHKQAEKAIEQSNIFAPRTNIVDNKQSDSRIQIKLKRKYEYKEEEPQSKAQKLFTLHSVSSDYSSKQQQRHQQVQHTKYQQEQIQIRPSLSIQFQQQPVAHCSSLPQSNQYCQTNPSNKSNNQPSQTHLSESLFKQSVIVKDAQVSKSDFTQQLAVLFNFLDQGHRGLLTDTNCLYQSLTEELKLLFSVILNHIRTKKRFYNLQKFIQQSKEILQIKNEVYNNNNKTSQNQNMVYQILRQNLDILKKKLPLMFVKCIYTQSCFDNSNLQSRSNSLSYGQSFVVDKIQIDRNKTKRQMQDGMNSNKSHATPSVNKDTNSYSSKNSQFDIKWTEKRQKDKENLQRYDQPFKKYNYRKVEQSQSELDMLQPQIYLQKKYGFTGKDQEQTGQTTSKINSIFLKTRGYLQNLDSYIKMR